MDINLSYMEFDKVVSSRRTCRDYKEKDFPASILAQILETARFAPSSANMQNWRFIIVKDKTKREAIADMCKGQYWMADAPVQVVICNMRKDVQNLFPDKGELFSIQNCAIIAAHLMLKAQDVGIASAFVGAFDEEKLRRSLDIPEDVVPEMIITLGYPNELDEEQARDDARYLTFFEKWGKKDNESSIWPLSKTLGTFTKKASQSANMAKTSASSSLSKIREKLRKN